MASAKKKISGDIAITVTGVVKEVVPSEKSDSIKHILGYAVETVEEESNWQNWQFYTSPYNDEPAKEYAVGTVVQLTFKYFGAFQSQNGSWYYTPVYPNITVVKWASDKKEGDATPQASTYNKPAKGKTPPPAEEVVEDF